MAWSSWQDLGGALSSAPAAAAWSQNRVDVFARGTDNAIWHSYWDGSWHLWPESLGGDLLWAPTAAPVGVSRGANQLDVFVRGSGDAVWWKSWNGGDGGPGWSAWAPLAADAGTDPAAVAWGPGLLWCFATGRNNTRLWTTAWRAP